MTVNNAVLIATSGSHATLRVYGNTTGANIVVTANATVNSDLSTSNEAVLGASIVGVAWSLSVNTVTVRRIVNSSVNNDVLVLSGTGIWNQTQGWNGSRETPGANLQFIYATGAVGTL